MPGFDLAELAFALSRDVEIAKFILNCARPAKAKVRRAHAIASNARAFVDYALTDRRHDVLDNPGESAWVAAFAVGKTDRHRACPNPARAGGFADVEPEGFHDLKAFLISRRRRRQLPRMAQRKPYSKIHHRISFDVNRVVQSVSSEMNKIANAMRRNMSSPYLDSNQDFSDFKSDVSAIGLHGGVILL